MQMRFFQLLLPTLLPHPRVDPPSKFLLVSKSGCKPFGWEMSEIVSSTSKVFFLVISYDTPATVCTPSQLLSVFSLFQVDGTYCSNLSITIGSTRRRNRRRDTPVRRLGSVRSGHGTCGRRRRRHLLIVR